MKVLGRLALTALAVLSVGSFALAGEKGVTQGKVTAVSDTAVTVAGEDGAVCTFEVTQGARVYGMGASRKSRMLQSSGKLTTLDDFVREGQYVTVHYREQEGTRYIKELRVSGPVAQS
jgi:methyl coenzyme M reductase subunit C-like uncharacterized protein (methanogenesis marker protein 7)